MLNKNENVFPYYGNKRLFADEVWKRFGNPMYYSEPFAGSLSVLLRRPELPPKNEYKEIINDLSGTICNAWRSIQAEPEVVSENLTWPSNGFDLQARNTAVLKWVQKDSKRLLEDPEYYDPKIAGYWLWGQCNVMNCTFGVRDKAYQGFGGGRFRLCKTQYLRKTYAECLDINLKFLHEVSERIKHAEVCAVDWKRCTAPAFLLGRSGAEDGAAFLDPPYKSEKRSTNLYIKEEQSDLVAAESYKWAVANGDKIKVAYCCHEGDFEVPDGWASLKRDFPSIQRKRTAVDLIMFSPKCIKVD